jgi:Na+-transporting methylmalonyl-CoA/oxaloacetate decarboxylase gamma subunit
MIFGVSFLFLFAYCLMYMMRYILTLNRKDSYGFGIEESNKEFAMIV